MKYTEGKRELIKTKEEIVKFVVFIERLIVSFS